MVVGEGRKGESSAGKRRPLILFTFVVIEMDPSNVSLTLSKWNSNILTSLLLMGIMEARVGYRTLELVSSSHRSTQNYGVGL